MPTLVAVAGPHRLSGPCGPADPGRPAVLAVPAGLAVRRAPEHPAVLPVPAGLRIPPRAFAACAPRATSRVLQSVLPLAHWLFSKYSDRPWIAEFQFLSTHTGDEAPPASPERQRPTRYPEFHRDQETLKPGWSRCWPDRRYFPARVDAARPYARGSEPRHAPTSRLSDGRHWTSQRRTCQLSPAEAVRCPGTFGVTLASAAVDVDPIAAAQSRIWQRVDPPTAEHVGQSIMCECLS